MLYIFFVFKCSIFINSKILLSLNTIPLNSRSKLKKQRLSNKHNTLWNKIKITKDVYSLISSSSKNGIYPILEIVLNIKLLK